MLLGESLYNVFSFLFLKNICKQNLHSGWLGKISGLYVISRPISTWSSQQRAVTTRIIIPNLEYPNLKMSQSLKDGGASFCCSCFQFWKVRDIKCMHCPLPWHVFWSCRHNYSYSWSPSKVWSRKDFLGSPNFKQDKIPKLIPVIQWARVSQFCSSGKITCSLLLVSCKLWDDMLQACSIT